MHDVLADDSHYNFGFLVSLPFLLDHNSHSSQENNTINLTNIKQLQEQCVMYSYLTETN